uniref:protein-glutamine gamma-glutamyltransferase K-like n=1 Tax=Styela clava TaxID=7725 RepID=UPI001939479B|nr:protein-glutamine gamma-glutamyltransferase K-like [Styela clava]
MSNYNKDPLGMERCNLLKDKNGPAHHTDDYETVSSRLVVRRGKPFLLRLTFDRDTNFPSDKIRFEFRTGGSPRVTQKSRYYLDPIDPKAGDSNNVGVRFSSVNTGKEVDIEVFTPSDMGVGQWMLFMYSKGKGRRSEKKSVVSDNIVILFNAWNKGDDVYMENEKWRKEYVLNDTGRQYYGSARSIGGMDWYFGQFETEVLNAVLKLITMEKLLYRNRGSAVEIARHLSALMNANDDDGVLVGNWSGEYDDGINPSDWVGSYAIFKQYLEKEKPVEYGQCWVFAGVLCTALRAIGIPARCNTNFESAHDTDANLTIDVEYDKDYNSLDKDDSIWNFHVWNDVWMARPDLPKGFGGWQALDATPQEESGGRMRCGPMSINAIKQGLIFMDYDGPFIYAEVNGSKRHWLKTIVSGKTKYEELYSEHGIIGKRMSTKQVGSDVREDVTHQYKFDEGTPEERLSFKTARKYVTTPRTEKKETKQVIKFTGDIPDSVPVGKEIGASFTFTNTSSTTQNVFLRVAAKLMQYNGSVVAKIHAVSFEETIPAGKSKTVKTTLSAGEYLSKVKNNDSIKFFALGGVKEGKDVLQSFGYHDTVELLKPTIAIKASGKNYKPGDSVTLNISFTNPLSTTLKPGVLRAEGSGIVGVMEIDVTAIKGGATFTKTITVKPRRVGERRVIVGYSSPSLSGLHGSITLSVSGK